MKKKIIKKITRQELHVIWEKMKKIWHLRRRKEVQAIPMPYVSQQISVAGNKLTIFNRGQEVYDIMLELFRSARHEILIDSFIFSGDALGEEIQNILIKKEAQGVDITIIIDPVGNFFTTPSFWHNFRQRRIKIKENNHYKNPWNIITLNLLFRDHRKLVIVDGKVAFLGGLNISKTYEKNWRDTQMMIEGNAVFELRLLYNEVYKGKRFRPLFHQPDQMLRKPLSFINTFPKEKPNRLFKLMVHLIDNARKEIVINQIYFIPTKKIRSALIRAAKRGVSVKILLSRYSDLNIIQTAVHACVAKLLVSGVRIFWYQPCVNHSKTLVIDEQYAIVSSANMDYRSFRRNYEISAIVRDARFCREMMRMHEQDFADSREENISHWRKRRLRDKVLSRIVLILRSHL